MLPKFCAEFRWHSKSRRIRDAVRFFRRIPTPLTRLSNQPPLTPIISSALLTPEGIPPRRPRLGRCSAEKQTPKTGAHVHSWKRTETRKETECSKPPYFEKKGEGQFPLPSSRSLPYRRRHLQKCFFCWKSVLADDLVMDPLPLLTGIAVYTSLIRLSGPEVLISVLKYTRHLVCALKKCAFKI